MLEAGGVGVEGRFKGDGTLPGEFVRISANVTGDFGIGTVTGQPAA